MKMFVRTVLLADKHIAVSFSKRRIEENQYTHIIESNFSMLFLHTRKLFRTLPIDTFLAARQFIAFQADSQMVKEP